MSDTDIKNEIVRELQNNVPQLKDQTSDFIQQFCHFFNDAYEMVCNKGLTPREAVKSVI